MNDNAKNCKLKDAKVPMSISLDEKLRDQIDQRAKAIGFDRSGYIRYCVRKEMGLKTEDAKQMAFDF